MYLLTWSSSSLACIAACYCSSRGQFHKDCLPSLLFAHGMILVLWLLLLLLLCAYLQNLSASSEGKTMWDLSSSLSKHDAWLTWSKHCWRLPDDRYVIRTWLKFVTEIDYYSFQRSTFCKQNYAVICFPVYIDTIKSACVQHVFCCLCLFVDD